MIIVMLSHESFIVFTIFIGRSTRFPVSLFYLILTLCRVNSMNFNKRISFFLLFLFSVLLGHSLVPHHHHTEIVFGTIHKECPVEHNQHQDPERKPLHCHAFNNVDFFEERSITSNQQLKIVVTLVIPVTQLSFDIVLSDRTHLYAHLDLPVQPDRYSGAISLRAPPASA